MLRSQFGEFLDLLVCQAKLLLEDIGCEPAPTEPEAFSSETKLSRCDSAESERRNR
jgi:hypothetical protein